MENDNMEYTLVMSCCVIGFVVLCTTLPCFLFSSKMKCCRGNYNNESRITVRSTNADEEGISNSYEMENLSDRNNLQQQQKRHIYRNNSCP